MIKVNRLTILMLLSVVGSIAFAQSDWTGEVLVHPVSDTSGLSSSNASRMLSLKGGSIKQRIAGPEIFVLTPPTGVSVADYMAELKASGAYKVVAPNQYAMPAATSNDPELNNQWHLTQISAQVAWNYTTGSAGKIVAIVDSGVDGNHPDLAPNLVLGYNSIQNLAQSAGGVMTDVHSTGHGTRCMGIAVAKGNNGIGISGVGWNLKGMPIRVTDQTSGLSTVSELLEGVTWAVDNGADVASVSYDQVSNSLVETTGAWARTQGALLVWAAGNNNTNLNTFDHFNVTVVGATDRSDAKTATSNFGRGVDLFAPGTQIYTTRKGGGYGNAPTGTSFATPQVAASLALLMEHNPTWDPILIERQLQLTARDIGAQGFDAVFSYGRLNTGLALMNLNPKWSYNSLPLPVGVTGGICYKILNNGNKVGVSNSLDKILFWPASGGVISHDLPGTLVEFGGVNEQNILVATVLAAPRRGIKLDLITGLYSLDSLEIGNFSHYTGINDQGLISGYYSLNGSSYGYVIENGFKKMIGENFLAGYFGSRPNRCTTINNEGHIGLSITSVGTDAFIGDAFNGNLSLHFVGQVGHTGYILAIGPNGFATGAYSDPQGRPQAFRMRYDFTGSEVYPPFEIHDGYFSGGLDINSIGESVGWRNDGASHFFYDLIRNVNIRQMTDNVPPGNFPDFRMMYDITEGGDVATALQYNSGLYTPAWLKRNRDLTYTLDLGQIGANPTYVGTIPPVVAIQFGNEAGVFESGLSIRDYTTSTGRFPVQVPESVGSTFRMRLQCNPLVTPGYTGCGYLSKIVPPLNQPAWPRDAFGQDPTTLYQGDCDLDNEIGPGDFEMVVGAFGTVEGDDDWNPQADVDGDGEVGPGDFEIIVENFGLAGD